MARQLLTVRPLSAEERVELEQLYRHTRSVRLRTRAQMILLAIEHQMAAPSIASIVRCGEETVRTWIKRFNAEGLEGLSDRPRPREPVKVTPVYQERLLDVVRRRPRTLDQPFSLWTLQRLADFRG